MGEMTEWQLLEDWAIQKLATNYLRLVAPMAVEFEYRRADFGHPSTYGLVSFDARPAESLTVAFETAWPADFTAEYRRRIMASVVEAIVDALVASPDYPHRGCTVTLSRLGFDPVSSSEASIRRATAGAMAQLKNDGRWELVTGRYRAYPDEAF
jgi:hypothetical protein